MAFGGGYSGQSYTQSSGSDLYRRGLYTVWKRTVPPPSLTLFDAPDREKCTARRTLRNGGKSDRERIDFAFELATARRPDPRERALLLNSLREFRSTYRQDQVSSSKLLTVGETKADSSLARRELAAWTTLASMILNLDETMTKQ